MSAPVDQTVKLLLLGHHTIGLAGLRLLLESASNIRVVGETSSPAEAVQMTLLEQPDIVLIELNTHEGSHLECLPSLFEAAKKTRVLVLMDGRDQELGQRAIRFGATGIVLKDKGPDLLITAILKVHAGEAWLDRLTIASVLTEMSRGSNKRATSLNENGITALTKREREVVTLVAMGLRNKQIAERLFISDVTVRHHLTSVFSKLLVSDRFELMIYAYRHGLAEPPAEN